MRHSIAASAQSAVYRYVINKDTNLAVFVDCVRGQGWVKLLRSNMKLGLEGNWFSVNGVKYTDCSPDQCGDRLPL